ncbi:MAG: peptidylprolyl isomerase [Kofleriaceae bacterium]
MWVHRIAVVAMLVACSSPPARPRPADDVGLRIRIARAEARRGAGLDELVDLATHGKPLERTLALRGLGRIGGPRALETLVAALADREHQGEAATAIGLAASLDEGEVDTAKLGAALVAALAQPGDHASELIEGLGRAGDLESAHVLVSGLASPSPELAAASAIALGRYGRRKLVLDGAARDALATAVTHASPRVRLAAAWALAREQLPPASTDKPGEAKSIDPAEVTRLATAATGLATLVADPDPEIRATATGALARRKAVTQARGALEQALRDPDWRVVVEAVRALSGDASDDGGREAVAAKLAGWVTASERDPTAAHAALEALRGLAAHTKQPAIAAAFTEVAKLAGASVALPAITRGWFECLAAVGIARGSTTPDYETVARCRLPDHLRLPLLGELIGAKVGSVATRRLALRTLLAHGDARVRVAGLTAFGPLWADGEAADHRAALATVIAALGSKDALVAGNAVDAATAIYEAGGGDPELDAAVIGRALAERDAELAAALYELIGKRTLAAGNAACRSGLAGAPVLARSAATCLKALGDPVPVPAIAAATAPPVDVDAVIGKQLRWHLATTRGEIVIALRPDIAPWAVATIVALTRKGFYNGLELHRVVPNFVVQGGDPTQSGWGGPGFTMPAEPSTGAGYVAGGVGIADAGRDSGGSQWFVMHSAAPHLDGRYTWIGSVVSGQKSADALLIGDKVTTATVE